jgi:tellurite resistance protein TerC
VWLWVSVVRLVLGPLVLDLHVFHKGGRDMSVREATTRSVVWIAVGLGAGACISILYGAERGGEYFAGYLIEKSLSLDNVFVFTVVFSYFDIPRRLQHRILFWGVFSAIVLRALLILFGAKLLTELHWLIYVFGVTLLVTGFKIMVGREVKVALSET